MKIAVLREHADGERRVAATPETARKFVALGAAVAIEAGAGIAASYADRAYAEAGATVAGEDRSPAGAGGERRHQPALRRFVVNQQKQALSVARHGIFLSRFGAGDTMHL